MADQTIPMGSISFLIICIIFIIIHIWQQVKVLKFFKIIIIPIIIFAFLIYNYKNGIVYHYIIDTILVFITMFCIKVLEYLPPFVIPPIHEPIKEFLVTFEYKPTPNENPLMFLINKLKSFKFLYCLIDAIKRSFYVYMPKVPDYLNSLHSLRILCSGLLGLIFIYTFWPTLAEAIAFITQSNREWVNVGYSNYSILTSIIFICLLIFFVRVYIYFNSNYRFFYEKSKTNLSKIDEEKRLNDSINKLQGYKDYSDMIVKLQEQAYTYRNIYTNIILITLAYYFIFIHTRKMDMCTSVETLFFKITIFAIIVAFVVLVSFRMLKEMFVKSGLVLKAIKYLNNKTFSKVKISSLKSLSDYYKFVPESSGDTSGDKSLCEYIDEKVRRTKEKNILLNIYYKGTSDAKLATIDCNISRTFMKSGQLQNSKTICEIQYEGDFQKNSIDSMIYNLCNASNTYTEFVERSAKCIPFIMKYTSFHLLPIMLALASAYVFTKLHRMLYPRKKYNDNDMLVETFLIFLCGYYPLMYILDSNDALSKQVKLIITIGFILLVIPTGIIYLKEKLGTQSN